MKKLSIKQEHLQEFSIQKLISKNISMIQFQVFQVEQLMRYFSQVFQKEKKKRLLKKLNNFGSMQVVKNSTKIGSEEWQEVCFLKVVFIIMLLLKIS
jgi:hypothetical protein